MALYILLKSSDNVGENSKLRRSRSASAAAPPAKTTQPNQLTHENTAFEREFGLDSSLIGLFDCLYGNTFRNYNLADIEENQLWLFRFLSELLKAESVDLTTPKTFAIFEKIVSYQIPYKCSIIYRLNSLRKLYIVLYGL